MSDETWLTDHVLGEDGPEQKARAERRLAEDPVLAQRAARLREIAGHLDGLGADVWHPLAVADAPAQERSGERRRRARPLALAAALTLMFAVGLGAGALLWAGGGTQPASRVLALRPLLGGSHAAGVVRVTPTGRLVLTVSGLAATQPGTFYEAWLMTSRSRLVPLASFRVTRGRTSLQLTLPTALTDYRYVDVSLQQAGAGPAHSTVSVLRGPT